MTHVEPGIISRKVPVIKGPDDFRWGTSGHVTGERHVGSGTYVPVRESFQKHRGRNCSNKRLLFKTKATHAHEGPWSCFPSTFHRFRLGSLGPVFWNKPKQETPARNVSTEAKRTSVESKNSERQICQNANLQGVTSFAKIHFLIMTCGSTFQMLL